MLEQEEEARETRQAEGGESGAREQHVGVGDRAAAVEQGDLVPIRQRRPERRQERHEPEHRHESRQPDPREQRQPEQDPEPGRDRNRLGEVRQRGSGVETVQGRERDRLGHRPERESEAGSEQHARRGEQQAEQGPDAGGEIERSRDLLELVHGTPRSPAPVGRRGSITAPRRPRPPPIVA